MIKEAEETRSHYSHYKKDYEKAISNGDEEAAQKAMDKMQEITQSPDFLKMRTIEVYDSKIQKMRQVMNLFNDEESKMRYSNLMKQLEERCLLQIESYDENIKK